MCVCVFQLAAAAEVTIRKDKENWDDEGRENEGREVEGVGINLGGLRNNWEKKFQGKFTTYLCLWKMVFEIVTTIV